MKRALSAFGVLLCCRFLPATGAPVPLRPTVADSTKDLFLLGKVWGFLKYFHPAVTGGKYDWDSALIHFLPEYDAATGRTGKSDALLAWINRLGNVNRCKDCRDTLMKGAKLRPDFSWINKGNFSPALVSKLAFIRDNRSLDSQFYIVLHPAEGAFLPLPQHEKQYLYVHYPDKIYGLLALFRFWNTIEYWYPYKYHLKTSWDNVLLEMIPRMSTELNPAQYYSDAERMAVNLQDSHGWLSGLQELEEYGHYMFPFTAKLVERRLVVTSILNDSLAKAAGVQKGDVIDSIDSKDVWAIAQELAAYCPASTEASLWNKLSYKITRTHNRQSRLTIENENGQKTVLTSNLPYSYFVATDFTPAYFKYPTDSAFCMLPGGICYINMGRLDRKDSVTLEEMVRASRSLIIDDRQNADEANGTGAVDIVARLVLPPNRFFFRFSSAEPSYPGVWSLRKPANMGVPAGPDYYKKRIAILINENSTSVGEFMTMAYQQSPTARLFGTPTAGADGPANAILLPGGVYVQFTNMGVYYPDGKETQRVGIQPDVMVPQTLDGYRHQKDEQMDKAIEWLTP